MNAQTKPLPLLVAELRAAKLAEDVAKNHRADIESQIVALFPKQDGEATVKDAEFSIAYKTTRTVDTEGLQTAWMSLSTNSQKAFTWKATLDLKQFRAIKELDPTAYGQLAAFVTSKPAKPAITLKD